MLFLISSVKSLFFIFLKTLFNSLFLIISLIKEFYEILRSSFLGNELSFGLKNIR